MNNFLDELQKKPYGTRVRILWGTTAVVAIIVIIIWGISLKASIKNTTGKSLVTPPVSRQDQSDSQFATVESMETSKDQTKIYFNLNNPSDDILNVSPLENISLTINNETISPSALQNRQGQPFAKKILSHTQIFGVLIFPATTEGDQGTLLFERMFLEKSPDNYLKQSIDLDLNQLKTDSKLRN
jgi:hypothetical protein